MRSAAPLTTPHEGAAVILSWIAAAFHIAGRRERGESVWLIQDSEVGLAKAYGIGDYLDLRKLAIGNSGVQEISAGCTKRATYEKAIAPWSSFARRESHTRLGGHTPPWPARDLHRW